MRDYSRYKYLIHMPGAATGAYSRNLQYLWTHGSIVLVWDHAATEFYYRHLVDGLHYVRVTESTVLTTLAELDRDPARAERLVAGARARSSRRTWPRTASWSGGAFLLRGSARPRRPSGITTFMS